MNLVSLFQETVAKRPQEQALIWGDQSWTWSAIQEASHRVASALTIERGDRIGIFLPNSPENIFAQIGVQMAGGIRVPINAAYTAREAVHPIEHTECRLVITDETRRPLVPGVRTILHPDAPPRDLPGPHEISLICFTSGTSGKPKGVPLTHAALAHNIQGLIDLWEWTERDRLLLSLPLMHLHGLGNGLNGWIASGCTLILQEKFHPETALEAIEHHCVTMFFGVPAMYHRLLEVPRRDVSSVRLWVSGSAPLGEGLAARFRTATGRPLVNRYGMTETAMITANPARGDQRGVGQALPGMDVRVIDSRTGGELLPGQVGEIVVRGPSVAKRYWGDEEDEATRHEDGFFRTGDLGYRDQEGYFFITGRAKDIIISGGTNIAPLEIEDVLLKHPHIAEAVVVPMPDPALGEVVRAVIVPRQKLATTDVVAWCEKHLAKFKRPRDVRIIEGPLPRNAMQKLDRKKARELYGA